MFKPTLVTLALGLAVVLLAGCTTKTQPQADSASQTDASSSVTAKAKSPAAGHDLRVTLYVEGMTKVQGIT
jgi:uncharacterized lipoprotein YajG